MGRVLGNQPRVVSLSAGPLRRLRGEQRAALLRARHPGVRQSKGALWFADPSVVWRAGGNSNPSMRRHRLLQISGRTSVRRQIAGRRSSSAPSGAGGGSPPAGRRCKATGQVRLRPSREGLDVGSATTVDAAVWFRGLLQWMREHRWARVATFVDSALGTGHSFPSSPGQGQCVVVSGSLLRPAGATRSSEMSSLWRPRAPRTRSRTRRHLLTEVQRLAHRKCQVNDLACVTRASAPVGQHGSRTRHGAYGRGSSESRTDMSGSVDLPR